MYLGERDEVSLAAHHGDALSEANQRVAGSWALQRNRVRSQLVRHLQTRAGVRSTRMIESVSGCGIGKEARIPLGTPSDSSAC